MTDPTGKPAPSDDIYLKIWDLDQRHSTMRWTLTTFFLGISFAIFGFSLQGKDLVVPLYASVAVAIAVYWFTYLLYKRFNAFNKVLRQKLAEMEEQGQTNLNLQKRAGQAKELKDTWSATQLIFWFGMLYTIAGVLVSVLTRP